jgi:hypothetical protein
MSSGRAVDWLRTRRSTLLLVLFFASLAFDASRVTGPFDWRMPLALLIGVYPHSSSGCTHTPRHLVYVNVGVPPVAV